MGFAAGLSEHPTTAYAVGEVIGQVRRVSIGKGGSVTATQVEITHAGQILSIS